MDKYVKELTQLVSGLEEDCGLCLKAGDGLEYYKMDMVDVMNYCANQIDISPTDAVKELNRRIGRKMVLLSYVSSRLTFFGKKRLDYSAYPCMTEVAKALLAFTSKASLNVDALQRLDNVLIVMDELDRKDKEIRKSLGYRYLRLFLVLALYGSYCNASIVASFILEQFIVRR